MCWRGIRKRGYWVMMIKQPLPNPSVGASATEWPPESCRADNFRPQIKNEIHLQWHLYIYLGYKRQYFINISIFLRFLSIYLCECVCDMLIYPNPKRNLPTSPTPTLSHYTLDDHTTLLLAGILFSITSPLHCTALPPTAGSVLCVIIQLDVSMDFK